MFGQHRHPSVILTQEGSPAAAVSGQHTPSFLATPHRRDPSLRLRMTEEGGARYRILSDGRTSQDDKAFTPQIEQCPVDARFSWRRATYDCPHAMAKGPVTPPPCAFQPARNATLAGFVLCLVMST